MYKSNQPWQGECSRWINRSSCDAVWLVACSDELQCNAKTRQASVWAKRLFFFFLFFWEKKNHKSLSHLITTFSLVNRGHNYKTKFLNWVTRILHLSSWIIRCAPCCSLSFFFFLSTSANRGNCLSSPWSSFFSCTVNREWVSRRGAEGPRERGRVPLPWKWA